MPQPESNQQLMARIMSVRAEVPGIVGTVRVLMAEAWEEGFTAGCASKNPYMDGVE